MRNYQIHLVNNSTRFISFFEDFEGTINEVKDRLTELQKKNYCARNENPVIEIKTLETEQVYLQFMFIQSSSCFSFFVIL